MNETCIYDNSEEKKTNTIQHLNSLPNLIYLQIVPLKKSLSLVYDFKAKQKVFSMTSVALVMNSMILESVNKRYFILFSLFSTY